MAAGPRLAPNRFRRFVELNAAPERTLADSARRERLTRLLDVAEPLLAGPARELMAALPRSIGQAMEPFGWRWNGYYVARGDRLVLGHAFGPPVCSPLERLGGPLESGMCFDALDLNQTLAAYDVGAWPGYVSCDAASGLATVAGIVCPLRDRTGQPIGVWDLDAAEPIEPGDVRFLDVFFATLASCVELASGDLAPA